MEELRRLSSLIGEYLFELKTKKKRKQITTSSLETLLLEKIHTKFLRPVIGPVHVQQAQVRSRLKRVTSKDVIFKSPDRKLVTAIL